MTINGPKDARTKAIVFALARIAAVSSNAEKRMDEMEADDPDPDDGAIEIGKQKEGDT